METSSEGKGSLTAAAAAPTHPVSKVAGFTRLVVVDSSSNTGITDSLSSPTTTVSTISSLQRWGVPMVSSTAELDQLTKTRWHLWSPPRIYLLWG